MAMRFQKPAADHSLEQAMRAALVENGRALPPVAAGPDPLAAAFQAPASADQYSFALPRGLDRDTALETQARQWFYEAGLPQGLVNGIVREYCRCLETVPPADAEARARAELAREWGEACDSKIALARQVIARCKDAAAIDDLLADSGLGNNPWLIRSLAAFGDLPAAGATGGRS